MRETTRNWLKGQTLKFEIDDISVICDVSAVEINPAETEDEFLTFCAAAGEQDYDWTMTFTAGQSLDADSLWSYIWEHSGETVPYVFAPYGNEAPSLSQPHFVGEVKIGAPPKLGGASSKTGSTWTFDAEWMCTGKPERVISSSGD